MITPTQARAQACYTLEDIKKYTNEAILLKYTLPESRLKQNKSGWIWIEFIGFDTNRLQDITKHQLINCLRDAGWDAKFITDESRPVLVVRELDLVTSGFFLTL